MYDYQIPSLEPDVLGNVALFATEAKAFVQRLHFPH